MPRPVPPPPPQPSLEETRRALRLLAGIVGATLALFALLTLGYSPDGWMVRYGRETGAEWNRYKIERLDPERLRAHEGGRIVWLVGSSILRESFDEAWLNEALAQRDSDWRVVKIGQTRGAAGISRGVLQHLPLRAGDRVVHSVAAENFRQGWLEFTDLPGARLQIWLTPPQIASIEEWSWAKRLEELASLPPSFYRWHEAHMDGVSRWLNWMIGVHRAPRERTRDRHLTFRRIETHPQFTKTRGSELEERMRLTLEDWTPAQGQFNHDGLQQMRAFLQEREVQLDLIDIPPRQEYSQRFLSPSLREAWMSWRESQPDLSYFPQLAEEFYYDMKHPNFHGRAALSSYLLYWLEAPWRGRAFQVEWSASDSAGDR